MDTNEEMSREAYESRRDAAAPRCHKCRRSENQAAMVGCALPTCRAFLCEACASETEWELEGCCDGHTATIASNLRQRLAVAQAALHTPPLQG